LESGVGHRCGFGQLRDKPEKRGHPGTLEQFDRVIEDEPHRAFRFLSHQCVIDGLVEQATVGEPGRRGPMQPQGAIHILVG
jgi:hypothetical protein